MLYRKIRKNIENFLLNNPNKVLIVEGARQIGKTFIIREIGKENYKNFIEINMLEDKLMNKDFENVRSIEDFYIKVSSIAGAKMQNKNDTLIFLDEIQEYPELITLLKFLNDDNKYTYIASGSLLGITLNQISSIPIGSIEIMKMYPLDFEEFLFANGMNEVYIDYMRDKFNKCESLDESEHNKILDLFKKYMLIGGLPDAVNSFVEKNNINEVRMIQNTIIDMYKIDSSKYNKNKKLKIQRVYELIPSNMENKKKRMVLSEIENKNGKTKEDYQEEFEYLISAGISIEVKSISEPRFPLIQSIIKSLIKLYMNDVGLLSSILYKNNVRPILNTESSINLGSVYETVVATELKAHGKTLYYYDNKKIGEVDFLIDDYNDLAVLPIEVKSGKNYYVHNAMNNLMDIPNYCVKNGYILSNEREFKKEGKILYMPIYMVMFIEE